MFHLQRELIDEERISVVPHFLSAIECQQLIAQAEESGFKSSPPSGRYIKLSFISYISFRWWSWSYTS